MGDGKTIWINGKSGECIARFSKFGIDIHRTVADQLAGLPECAFCTHKRTDESDWQLFLIKLREIHGIDLGGILCES